jgi:hypothetical protein
MAARPGKRGKAQDAVESILDRQCENIDYRIVVVHNTRLAAKLSVPDVALPIKRTKAAGDAQIKPLRLRGQRQALKRHRGLRQQPLAAPLNQPTLIQTE